MMTHTSAFLPHGRGIRHKVGCYHCYHSLGDMTRYNEVIQREDLTIIKTEKTCFIRYDGLTCVTRCNECYNALNKNVDSILANTAKGAEHSPNEAEQARRTGQQNLEHLSFHFHFKIIQPFQRLRIVDVLILSVAGG